MLSTGSNSKTREMLVKTDFKTTKYQNFVYNSALQMDGVAYVYNGPMNVIGFMGQTLSQIASGTVLFTLPYSVSVQQFGGLHGSDGNVYGIQIINGSITTYNNIPAEVRFREQIVFFTYL